MLLCLYTRSLTVISQFAPDGALDSLVKAVRS
jgi:hypothetical protein